MSVDALDSLSQRTVVGAYVRGFARDEMGSYLAHILELADWLPLLESPTMRRFTRARPGFHAKPIASRTRSSPRRS